jgi:quinol monooxygenase YgiN
MLVIAGRIRIKPERREDALRLARDLTRETVKEAGCRSYRFYGDLEDPAVFLVFEEWDGPEALARHFTTPHMQTFLTAVPDLVAGPPEISRYDVATSARL